MAKDKKIGTAELLYRQAERMGLRPSWVAADGLFAISLGGQEQYIHFARSPLNSHIGTSLARDKHLTRLVLERHNMQNIPFCRPRTRAEAIAFLYRHGKIIVKPVRGSGAQDIRIITQVSQLQPLDIKGYIFEKYISGMEMRYLVLDSKVIAVHRSDYGVSVAASRPLRRISYPRSTWDDSLVATSLEIAQALGLTFAAVDYMIDSSGHAYILEVNTAPGLKWFHAPSSGPVVDVAGLFLESFVQEKTSYPLQPRDALLMKAKERI